MKFRIEDGDIHLIDLTTRLPFRYGIAVMTRTPHAFVRVRLLVDGKTWTGVSADHLPPRWFTKDPRQSPAEEVAGMLEVIEHAVGTAAGVEGESVFDVCQQVSAAQGAWGRDGKLPPLLSGFGASLVERAVLEAACRAAGRPFSRLLRENAFGIRLADLHPELAGMAPADLLPPEPLSRITARHTVGLSDPIREEDIAAGDRLADGLPQSLERSIEAYRLRHLKVKVSGDLASDAERLRRIAALMEARAGADWAVTLDGNEHFRSCGEFRGFWEQLRGRPGLGTLFERLLFVEQPLHRDVALLPSLEGELLGWPARPHLIIDESDGELSSLPQALRLGYAGTSHKNCKGVLKGLAHACLLEKLRRQSAGKRYILSGEDLVNIGPVALLQDLAVCAALGIQSVERNGHHYFAGLSPFPEKVREDVLRAHGDLYRRAAAGWPALRIEEGSVSARSVVEAPFGAGFVLDVEQFTPSARFRESYFGNRGKP